MNSQQPGPCRVVLATANLHPSRSAGPLGRDDAADPSRLAILGDTPGPLGVRDHAAGVVARRDRLVLGVEAIVRKLEQDLDQIVLEMTEEVASAAVDLAGLGDRTPIREAVGAAFGFKEGSLLSTGLSIMSMVPYTGDTLAQPAEATKSSRNRAAVKAKAREIGEVINAQIERLKGNRTKPTFVSPKQIEEQIEAQLSEALDQGNEKIVKANREIQELHEQSIRTGEWKFDGLEPWQFPDDALRALRAKYAR